VSTANPISIAMQPLGQTGMTISRVGFGAWAIGGPDWAVGWGAQDDGASVRAIRHAVDRGVNWIDTAAIYGLGHSEEIVARAVAEIPVGRRPYIFTKCGQVWDPADRNSKIRVGRADSIRREVEDSLRRLRVEQIDLYQMHWPPEDGSLLEEYWGTLLDLKREGKVRAVGLSNHDVAQLEAAEKLGHVDTLQPPLSALRRSVLAKELPWCVAHGTGVIVYSPMQSGLLSGGFSFDRAATLSDDDWRSRDPDFTGDALRRNLMVADAFAAVSRRHAVSTAAVAVAWTLAMPGVSGAIVGARSQQQVDGWVAAATITLQPEDMAEVSKVLHVTEAGEGPIL
jgi:aryl-alcohol dehydrogenase-like predicted oxidoreductase